MQQKDYALGEQLIAGDVFAASSIYVDIGFLKYIDLGKVISHQDISRSIYEAIIKVVRADSFKDRSTNDVDVLFKDVENIESVLTGSQITDDIIFIISPTFDGSIDLIENNLIISDNARHILSKKATDTVITINVSALPQLSDRICRQIADEYSATFNTPIRINRKPLTNADTAYDAYFIDDLNEFNRIMEQPLNAGSFIPKYIFCQKLLPLSKLSDLPTEGIPFVLSRLDVLMTAASKFQFIQPFKLYEAVNDGG